MNSLMNEFLLFTGRGNPEETRSSRHDKRRETERLLKRSSALHNTILMCINPSIVLGKKIYLYHFYRCNRDLKRSNGCIRSIRIYNCIHFHINYWLFIFSLGLDGLRDSKSCCCRCLPVCPYRNRWQILINDFLLL